MEIKQKVPEKAYGGENDTEKIIGMFTKRRFRQLGKSVGLN